MSSSARITDSGRKGDLRIGFGWERQNNMQVEPVMYIWAVRSPRQIASVPISLMYLFDTREKDRAGQLKALEPAKRIADVVYGGIPSRIEIHRVLDAVTDFLTDLKNMPPPSTLRNPEMLEAVMRKHGYDVVR